MEGNWVAASSPTNRYQYNGIEFLDNFGLNLNFAANRTLDASIGRWLQQDPMAESMYGLSPYNSMGNNPMVYSDPEGDFPFLAVAIGMAIGALTNTATQVAANGGFNNWNWGSFVGSVVAGGIGGGVSSALTSVGVGGFAGGAVTGGASGFSQSLISGLINGDLSGNGLFESTLLGAGIGGIIQGLGAAFDGRRFWDGAKVEYQLLVEDPGLKHIMQNGDNNCLCATGEMGIQSQGGSYTQKDVRSWMGGDPNLDPLQDVDVVIKIGAKTGLNVDGIGTGYMQSDLYINKNDYIVSSLRSGRSVHMTVPGNGTVAHSVSVKGTFIKTVTKVNGSTRTSLVHRIFDPARSRPYNVSSRWINNNDITVFSMWK